jgi:hypothetical protein
MARAVQKSDFAALDGIVAAGGDPNCEGTDGFSLLTYAMLLGKTDAICRLLELGADPNWEPTNGPSALELAAKVEWASPYLKLLLDKGADPNVPTGIDRETPIFAAIRGWRGENIKVLLDAGADVNFTNRDGQSPTYVAVKKNQFAVAYRLLRAGADCRIRDCRGYEIADHLIETGVPLLPEAEAWRQKVIAEVEARGVNLDEARRRQGIREEQREFNR